ncbi:IS30 family transposase [Mycoplasmopsis columbina]|uniref:IS30 family transposase n=1 Tax=Mycoplasmopsis columbina TaxID=114881 RepID=UPI001004E1B7|nr:IS30 family transposase [Mycoplasmopsis columbina]VEU76915.1 transposase [Mycoplasmopsis columbina]VEU76916.1 transposase [Mycoplasmopsis columbina]VEU77189.1 transposase [Mycoplasmopsis columbina]
MLLKKFDYSLSKIALIIGINKSSLSREIKLNSGFWGYFADEAEEKSQLRKKWSSYFKMINKFNNYQEFNKQFKKLFDKKTWGVEITHQQILNNFQNIKIPSLRTVFNWINSGFWIIKSSDRLRKKYKKGGKRNNGPIDRLVGKRWVRPFWTRPNNINNRSEFGHWEIDLIIGKKATNSEHLLTFVERKTRFGIIKKVPSKNSWIINLILWDLIKKYRLNVKSITTDNGFEFNKLFYIGYRLKIYIYQADPYASFEKGTIENFNVLVRRYFKKQTSFSEYSDQEILEVQNKINKMPRKIFGWFSADENFFMFNNIDDKWNPISLDEPLYKKNNLKRLSNTKRNLFFKKKKY